MNRLIAVLITLFLAFPALAQDKSHSFDTLPVTTEKAEGEDFVRLKAEQCDDKVIVPRIHAVNLRLPEQHRLSLSNFRNAEYVWRTGKIVTGCWHEYVSGNGEKVIGTYWSDDDVLRIPPDKFEPEKPMLKRGEIGT